jgi:hypothetical protein
MNIHRGKNLANQRFSKSLRFFRESGSPVSDEISVFISHISTDLDAAIAISEYIKNAGFNVYLDIHDKNLQNAVNSGDPIGITRYIEKGISICSHVLCIVSEDTINSWWVPYELGYGKRGQKKLLTLLLKDTVTLPEYLSISNIIHGTRSLNLYLNSLLKTNLLTEERIYKSVLAGDGYLFAAKNENHPLDNYLDWDS